MIIAIEKHGARAHIDTLGAQLISFERRGVECLWQGDASSWNGHSPFLFPVIGKVNEGCFTIEGLAYPTEIHGFAKDFCWELTKKEDTRIELVLASSPETLRHYPFDFILGSTFEMTDGGLVIERRITNASNRLMPFFSGEHPGFKVPLLPDDEFDKCVLEFEQKETVNAYNYSGTFRGRSYPCLNNEQRIELTRSLFNEKRVLLLYGLKSESVTLHCRNRPSVTLGIKGFSSLGIWTTPQKAAFVCIEPWNGLPSKEDSPLELSLKEGVTLLEPQQSFTYSYFIR